MTLLMRWMKNRFPTVFVDNPFTVWDFFPPAFNCPHEMERVGRLGDGGKWFVSYILPQILNAR